MDTVCGKGIPMCPAEAWGREGLVCSVFLFLRTAQGRTVAHGEVLVPREALLICVSQVNFSFDSHLDLESILETNPWNFFPARHW